MKAKVTKSFLFRGKNYAVGTSVDSADLPFFIKRDYLNMGGSDGYSTRQILPNKPDGRGGGSEGERRGVDDKGLSRPTKERATKSR